MPDQCNPSIGSKAPYYCLSSVYKVPMLATLHVALRTPIHVANKLDKFLLKVFQSKDLMVLITEPEDLTMAIYERYAAMGNSAGKFKFFDVLDQAYNGWQTMNQSLHGSIKAGACYQGTGIYLTKVDPRIFFKIPLAPQLSSLIKGFLRFPFNFKVMAEYRVYLNLTYESRIQAVIAASKASFRDHSEIYSMKIAGPYADRADNVVIYCSTEKAAKNIAAAMRVRIDTGELTCASQTVPAMTKRFSPGIGISIGAEPKPQGTGLMAASDLDIYKTQSFGGLRSQIIAAAILNYRANLNALPDEYTVFRQLVAIGFKGHGLDPANPDKNESLD